MNRVTGKGAITPENHNFKKMKKYNQWLLKRSNCAKFYNSRSNGLASSSATNKEKFKGQ